jgi:hypothetical protein
MAKRLREPDTVKEREPSIEATWAAAIHVILNGEPCPLAEDFHPDLWPAMRKASIVRLALRIACMSAKIDEKQLLEFCSTYDDETRRTRFRK